MEYFYRKARQERKGRSLFFADFAFLAVNLYFASAIACLKSSNAWIGVGSTP